MQPVSCTIALDQSNPSSGVFHFNGETHTMGNAIRQTILPNRDVQFCGYTVPHPAEIKMAMRIQANDGVNIVEVINKGIDGFAEWCQQGEDALDAAMASRK